MRFLIPVVFLFTNIGHAQSIVIDERDSSSYQTFELAGNIWFQSNLRYVTPKSWCNQNPYSLACKDGNYYYPQELVNVCPEGWKVPTWKDYKRAIKAIEDSSRLDSSAVTWSEEKFNERFSIKEAGITGITLINDSSFFDFTSTGWIEGDRWHPQETQTTQWIVEDISTSPQPHVHIRENEIVMHTHKHHVDDREKKRRRFSVRCVKEK